LGYEILIGRKAPARQAAARSHGEIVMKYSIFAAGVIVLAAAGSAADAPAPPKDAGYREVSPDNLVQIDTNYGPVVVELAPEFAPKHVERLRALIRAHFYDGKSFYRVIDGFVAQGGEGEGTASTGGPKTDTENAKWPPLKAEFDAPFSGTFTPLGSPDLYAQQVGHIDGFPVARDGKDKRMWLIHCPGTFAFARDNGPDTATTEFYIVIGEAPRRLDRDLTAFGRVLWGMENLQKLARGIPSVDNGVIQDPAKRDPIIRMRLASDMPESERPEAKVQRTDSAEFQKVKQERMHPTSPFYFRKPPPVLDVCLVPVDVKHK
jgi:peptidylprolyl isomerase